jgi:hypothetical protein
MVYWGVLDKHGILFLFYEVHDQYGCIAGVIGRYFAIGFDRS